MARSDERRLLARVARMYYAENLRQADIAAKLFVSQATVSRLIQRAREEGIVRIRVDAPLGTFAELEARLESRFGLTEVVVADCDEDREEQVLSRIGEAAATYLETTLQPGECIGISSWSESLLRMVDNIHPLKRPGAELVVQILGGMGNPAVQRHATNLTTQLAHLTGARAMPLATQGVVGSLEARRVLASDPYVRETMGQFGRVTMALVGVGAVEPSKLLADSGNVFTEDELAEMRRLGAAGDICLNFFDGEGRPVRSPFQGRVIGITLEELRAVRRVVAVAGGRRKLPALLGAVRGRLVDVLVTDRFTAERLDAAAASLAA